MTALSAAVALSAFLTGSLAAQGPPVTGTSGTTVPSGAPGTARAGTATQDAPPRAAPAISGGPLLDAPVSRTQYRVGPGDVLDVALLGDLTRVSTVVVAPEGTVLIPGVGITRVLGLNIDDAERRIRELVLHYFRNVDVRVSLAQVRSFKVFVVGDVPSPGVRAANAATRVSEVVPDDTAPGGVRHRNVVLRRATGDTLSVDLVRFRQLGDLSANPTLREGDALVVPAVDQTVQVYGRVAFPGGYEFRPGETLAQLLTIANGGGNLPADAADSIRLTRFVRPEQRDLRVLSRQQALGVEGAAFLLRPGDAIYIPRIANFRVQRTASVLGQVLRPGTYPIRPETTTVRDLVSAAGGFTSDAAPANATLQRLLPASDAASVRQLANVPPELLTDQERRVLLTRSQGDPTRVVLDFQTAAAGRRDALDQPLEAGDELTVPVRRTGVTVLGAVTNPGIVPFAPGQSVDYYVGLAGGYARRADRRNQSVLKARLGGRADARDIRDIRTIDAGDQIVVPFRDRSRRLENFQTLAAVIGTITGTLLSVYTVRQLARNP